MGLTKTESFTEQQNEMASIFKALGHPARIAILQHLIETDQCICGDIVNVLPLAQPTVSQHLKELKSAGLIKGNISGNAICYCVDGNNWEKYSKLLNKLFNQYTDKINCC